MELNQERLVRLLSPRPFRFFQRVDSTQDLAREWLQDGAPEGAVVIADEQLKGRGRHGHDWTTPPGSALALSVILRPPAEALPHVTMLGALAIAGMLDKLSADDVGIKWPNDVQLKGRKVCGVLPEAVWNGSRLQGVILGIGVNVRVDFSGTPLADTAISIEPALRRTVNRVELLALLLGQVDLWMEQLGQTALFDAWKARLTTLGQQITVSQEAGGTTRGVAEDVDSQGALLLRDDKGEVHRILAGDVSFAG